MMEDMLSTLSDERKPEQQKQFSNSFDPWKDEIKPRTLDITTLRRFGRKAVIVSHGDVSDEAIDSLKKALEKLDSVEFTLRLAGDKKDKLEAAALYYPRKDFYLPWKKFNTDVDPKLFKPTKYAYELSKGLHKAFDKVTDVVRGFIARNTHMMLGDKCDEMTNIVICYTSDGAESKKDIDYKTTGNASYFIEVAEKIGAPVFNLKRSDALERLTKHIESTYGASA